MKYNSKTGSMKGHIFDPDDPDSMPTFTSSMSLEKRKAWAKQETERYRIIKNCPTCGEPLIEEESVAHVLNHAPSELRPLARMLAELDKDDREKLYKIVKAVLK